MYLDTGFLLKRVSVSVVSITLDTGQLKLEGGSLGPYYLLHIATMQKSSFPLISLKAALLDYHALNSHSKLGFFPQTC